METPNDYLGKGGRMAEHVISILLQVLSVINVLFVAVVIFTARKNPTGTWVWLLVIIAIPYVGFVLYLLIGLEGRKRRIFADKSKRDAKLFDKFLSEPLDYSAFIREQREGMERKDGFTVEGADNLDDLVFLNFTGGHGAFTPNNSVTAFHEGEGKFEALIRDIGEAEKYIHIQYYIVRDDDLGRKVISALAESAARGVEVRFIVDGMGSHKTPKRFYKPLTEAGGRVTVFVPPRFIRMNYRNHRKIVVIDGMVGYIGGLNIGNEYLGKDRKFGCWRDSHIRIAGDAVKSLELRFMMDWAFCTAREIPFTGDCFPQFDPTRPICSGAHRGVPMQIVSSGPDTRWSHIHYGYNKMITEADKSIYIQTPYFVPDDSIFEALRIAALSGVDVRIMIPANPDHFFVYWASLSYLGELLEAGVKCYQYEKGFTHGKVVLIDGCVTAVGTANMDVRSFKLNFEIHAFIYDGAVTAEFTEKFFEYLKDCTEIDNKWYANRSALTKTREAVSRLLSPLL